MPDLRQSAAKIKALARSPFKPRDPTKPTTLPLLARFNELNPRTRKVAAGAAAVVLIAVVFTAAGPLGGGSGTRRGAAGPPPVYVTWGDEVQLHDDGYEPGLAVDSQGVLYMTAHKNLNNKTSWPYLASWFLISKDQGATWTSPDQPPLLGSKWKLYLGDEGDIAVDARDYVYFVDTYLADNNLHVWANGGVWQYSEHVQKTNGQDDRPWIAAQGNGILHYLGNNGQEVNGGRIWYYRSTNGGRTFTPGTPIPGDGWATLDTERDGQHVYIITESQADAAADIQFYMSEDQGKTFDFSKPVVIAHRDGPGREFPHVAAGQNGMVYAEWNEADNDSTTSGTRIWVGVSDDYGRDWNVTEVTPFKGYIDYPTINVGPDNTLGFAFYATTDLPVANNSTWFLYGAMQKGAMLGSINLNFSKATGDPPYIGSNLHALHDFFEIVVDPSGALDVAFQHYDGPCNGCSDLYFIRGTLPATRSAPAGGT